MKKLLLLSIVLLLLASSVAFPNPASACSCAPLDTPQQEFIQSDAVFVGKIVGYGGSTILSDFLRRNAPFLSHYLSDERAYIFAVSKSWKGVEQNSIAIQSGRICGAPFLPGLEYIVYASKSGLKISADMCSRTTTTDPRFATEDLAYLNTLPSQPLKNSYLPPILFSSLLGISILLLIGFIRYRRKNITTSE